MRKNETLAEESARKRAEAELPGRIESAISRVRAVNKFVRAETLRLQQQNNTNPGGERSGMIGEI